MLNPVLPILPVDVSPERLRGIRHVALDMDGTLYKGGTLFPQTLPFLKLLRGLGVGYSFLTNNPTKSRADYITALGRLGIAASLDDVYSTVQATLDYLRKELPDVRRLFLFGTASMTQEVLEAGYLATRDDPSD